MESVYSLANTTSHITYLMILHHYLYYNIQQTDMFLQYA